MNPKITPSQTKALAIGLVFMFIFFALIYALLIEPAMSLYRTNDETIAELRTRLSRYQHVATGLEVLEKELEQLSRDQSVNNYYLKSKSATLASAELQAHVKNVIDDADGRLVSTQPLAENDRDSSRRVKIQVRMAGDIETVRRVFYKLEFGTPGLLVDEVSMVHTVSSRRRPAATEAAGALDVRFNLTGFMRGVAS
ncbi:MAG: type II secretion system protein GspM [Granulosicoccaceae bacterium]|jgi:general secretion pathway protein M